MARTAVPITSLSLNTAGTIATVAADPTNGHTVGAGGKTANMVVCIYNSGAATGTVTVAAGDYPPAFRSLLGSVQFTVASSVTRYIALESARFNQDDGSLSIDLNAGFTGTLAAFRLPNDAA